MRELDEERIDYFNQMIAKLKHDPDKFERMFAAQYLAKYSYLKSKKALCTALYDEDPEVAECVRKLIEDRECWRNNSSIK
ncbi:MAG: hypothetical protein ACFFAU_05080 [Candidatus Hodarchaeota archaeon]